MSECRQRTECLLEENRQLRQKLASEFRLGEQLTLRARELLASSRRVRLESAGVADFCAATARRRRSRPHLVVLPGGSR